CCLSNTARKCGLSREPTAIRRLSGRGIYTKITLVTLVSGRIARGCARPRRLRGRGGKMKSVRCLLMGSAAGLMAVSASQAADLPVRAAPVEYVKVCNLYGAGFWYVPGTDTCMKIGAFLRTSYGINANGTTPIGSGGGA